MTATTARKAPMRPEVRALIDDAVAASTRTVDPWPALERAHIASQPWAWPHTRVHLAMLRVAWRQRDRREMFGQLIRAVVAGPGSATGRYPVGNTGRAAMPLTATAPVPPDLAEMLGN